jgi:hypothetical protein
MSIRSTCFIDKAFFFFLQQSKTSSSGTTLIKFQIIRISELLDVRLKEVYCTSFC